ncbi:ATP-binding protein [Streptomyces sp. NPDC102467]|uniref:ATP-binding protein n=1 Tax=Streptomyces sp. NPDC102467 TaxID=3366179 RepID=UPI003810FB35
MENFPAETTSFIGRDRELGLIEEALTRHRLITLTGVGGVGKSRLAARAARRAAPGFRDGARLISLSPLREPSLLGHVVFEELRLVDQSAGPPEDLIAEWLVTRDVLLVLDTCEHLTGECARLATRLLDAAPGLRILATSREPLGAAGEWRLEVEPLPVAADARGGTVGGDAVALFADRAAAAVGAVGGFRLDGAERDAAVTVCRRLDGIPLAIELAAAQLPDLTMKQLDERLLHRFDTLVAPDAPGATAAPRHRTLRTTIGWSHELCAPLERLLWARLSVFAAGFDLADAQAVTAGGPLSADAVPDLLDGLVSKSLVRPVPGTKAPARYRLLDTVREYGAQWLRELSEETAVLRAHLERYRDLAARADREWLSDRQTAWSARITAEHANIRAALDFALRDGLRRIALEMTGALWVFWFACGFAREGRHYLDRALAGGPEPWPEYGKALWAGGVVCVGQGALDVALRHSAELRALAATSADPTVRVAADYLEGTILTQQGEPERALITLDTAPPETLWGSYEAACFMNRLSLAFARIDLGDLNLGKAIANGVSTELAARGECWGRAFGDYLQALAEFGLGNWAEAAGHARASLRGKAELHDTLGVALAADLLAAATVADGQGETGARLLGAAQRLWLAFGRPQMGNAQLVAVRESAERRSLKALGEAAYTTAYEGGLYDDTVDGIVYSLDAGTGP